MIIVVMVEKSSLLLGILGRRTSWRMQSQKPNTGKYYLAHVAVFCCRSSGMIWSANSMAKPLALPGTAHAVLAVQNYVLLNQVCLTHDVRIARSYVRHTPVNMTWHIG